MTTAERAALPVMAPGRADVIVAGSVILVEVMERFGFDEAIVSETDILDGLVLEMLEMLDARLMLPFDRERVPEACEVPCLGPIEIPTFGPGRVTPGRPTVRAEEELLGALRAAGRPVPQQEVRSDGHRRAWSLAAA